MNTSIPSILRSGACAQVLMAASLTTVAFAGWEANLPDPLSYSSTLDAPFKYTGIIRRGGATGSASVVKHPRVLLTAAHCLYDDDGNPQSLPLWFHRYNGTSAPDPADGTELYGHRRFNAYVNYLQGGGEKNDSDAFNWDIATMFGFEDMAYGATAPYTSDGAGMLTGYDNKRAVGYPVSLYSEDNNSPRPLPEHADDEYKMHSTHMIWHRFWKKSGTDHYYRAVGQVENEAKLVSAPGNSGGPLFVKDGSTYKVAGVVVSGVNDHLIDDSGDSDVYCGRTGVRALNGNAISELIDPLEHAGDCNLTLFPSTRYHGAGAGSGSISVDVGAGCSWYASLSFQDMQWIHPVGSITGKGDGTIDYDLEPNPLATTRTGKITIAGKVFTIHQLGEETVDLRDRGSNWRSLSHEERAPGQNLTIHADVYNGGNTPSGVGYKVRYYASVNNVVTSSDIYLGERTMGALGNGDWAAIDKTVSIPSNLGGHYYIGWKIDALNAVGEVDEGNNTVVMEDPVFIKRVDLRDGGSHYNYYDEVFPGHAVHFKGKVLNEGNAESGSFQMKFFLSPYEPVEFGFSNGGEPAAPGIEPGDRLIGTRSFSVGEDENREFDSAFVLPTNFQQGTYRVKWAIDATNSIAETDEDNNVVQMQSVLIEVKSTIDLRDRGSIYQGLSAATRKPGESLTIYGDVYNGGNLGSGPYKVAFYLSSDDEIEPGVDLKIGEKSMPGLFKGDHDALDHTLQLPMSLAAGTYTVGWVIDPDGTATQNQGMVLVGQGGGSQGEKIELTQNNKVVMVLPSLTISSPTLVLDPGDGGGGIDGPGDLTGGDPDSGDGGGGREPGSKAGAGSEFRVTAVRIENGLVKVEFPTVLGRTYTLEASADAQSWSALGSVEGNGGTMTLSAKKGFQLRRFFRVTTPDLLLLRSE